MKLLRKLTRRGLGADNGSTIVGVMAALVFIGIVTGVMVKNTGAQSAASIGYGAAMTMHSTVNSGLVATEGFFRNDTAGARRLIDSLVAKPDTERFVYGVKTQRRELGTSKQYFSSRTKRFQSYLDQSDYVRAGFQIAAGKNAKGRGADSALTFLQLGNLKQEQVEYEAPSGINAVYSGSGISDANAAFNVTKGGATFLGEVKLQNYASDFEKSAYFGAKVTIPGDKPVRFKDDAWFMGVADIQGEAIFDSVAYFKDVATFAKKATFNGKAYFKNVATFKAVTFNDVAYFEGKPTFEETVTFNGKAYFVASAEFKAATVFGVSAPAFFGGDTVVFNNLATTTFKNVVWFDGTVKFCAVVTFDKWARFEKDVEFENQGKGNFYGETYFRKNLKLGGTKLDAYHRIGFDGTIAFNGQTIKSNNTGDTKYDVLINATFTGTIGKLEGSNSSVSGDHKAWWSVKFGSNSAANSTWKAALQNFQNVTTTTVISGSNKTSIDNGVLNEFKYIEGALASDKAVVDFATPMPAVPTPPPDTTRKDPELSLSPIYDDAGETPGVSGGKVKIIPAVLAMTKCGTLAGSGSSSYCTGNTTFDIGSLEAAYKKGKDEGYLFNGYLVVRVKSTDPNINFSSTTPGTFYDKIIIIIDEGATFNTGNKFYISGPQSSTLIYVGKGSANIMNFGSNGLFRGLVYIDKTNTATNEIQFTGNGRIVGAVHNFSTNNKLVWNGGNSDHTIPIEFDQSVLKDFGALYAAGGNATVVINPGAGGVEVNAGGILVRSLGVYFY